MRHKITLITVLLIVVLAFSAVCGACGQQKKVKKDMRILVVYYSYTGNTKGIAERVARETGADLERLEPEKAYSSNYDEVVDEAQREVESDYKRPIRPLRHSLKDYDVIVVGSPTWWYKMASPVLTFLSSADLKGKIVVPFMTNAGWPGTVISDMTRIAEGRGATVEYAKKFKFNTHSDGTTTRMETSEKELKAWIDNINSLGTSKR